MVHHIVTSDSACTKLIWNKDYEEWTLNVNKEDVFTLVAMRLDVHWNYGISGNISLFIIAPVDKKLST